jgi:hypothetical protein
LDDLIVGSIEAESRAGKSHVIFGKTDGTVIELSAITSGTGGVVINGENAPLTSPALETDRPLISSTSSPLITNPPVSLPLAIAERSIV